MKLIEFADEELRSPLVPTTHVFLRSISNAGLVYYYQQIAVKVLDWKYILAVVPEVVLAVVWAASAGGFVMKSSHE